MGLYFGFCESWPYPSLADVFWLAGYFPFLIALFYYLQIFRPAVSKRMFQMAGVVACGIGLAIFVPLMFFIEAEQASAAMFFDIAYPAFDLALFVGAFLGLLVFTTTRLKGNMATSWLLIFLGFLMYTIGDVLFSYTTLWGTYWEASAHPLELFFHFGDILLLLAFYTHTKEL